MKIKAISIFLLLLLLASLILMQYNHIENLISFSFIKNSSQEITLWISSHGVLAYVYYLVIFYIVNTLHFPMAIPIFPILGGGFFDGYSIALFSTIGMTLSWVTKCYLLRIISRKIKMNYWLVKRADVLLVHFNNHKFFYFFTYRLIPFLPRELIIWLASRSNMKWRDLTFWWAVPSIVFGLFYTVVGKYLNYYLNSSITTWGQLLSEPAFVFPPLILAGILLLPLFYKKIAKAFLQK